MSKTKFRHIFAGTAVVLLVTVLMLAFSAISVKAWSGTIATAFSGGDGSKDSPYEISTAEQLAYFAQVINDGTESNYASACYNLTADIVLNDTLEDTPNEWTAIGTSEHPFKGTFDGNGKTIKGVYINKSNKNYQGLFGYSKGLIKDVGVKTAV